MVVPELLQKPCIKMYFKPQYGPFTRHMYIYIYIYFFFHIHIHKYKYIYIYTYLHILVYTYIYKEGEEALCASRSIPCLRAFGSPGVLWRC